MINVDFYEVWDNFSEDGRGTNKDKVLGRFTKESDAKEFAKGRGNYGGNASLTHYSFWVAETLGDHLRIQEVEEKRVAFAKLTNREKKLLGLIR